MYMDLERAIQAPTDYSPQFVQRVAELGEAITSRIGAQLEHDPDMNYSAAQKLTLWLDENGGVAQSYSNALFQLDFLVSSKAHVYTIVCWKRDNLGRWQQSRESQDIFADLLSRAGGCLQELGYAFLPESNLSTIVDGHLTDLDGAPATLFQVLFSELY